jgi:uroporphyrinogen III methyltransferase/synthase
MQKTLRVGTRGSQLALIQTKDALMRMQQRFADVAFEVVPVTTLGDRDLTTDLRASPADFFTRDLDEALRRGEIDLAIHSAKDLPDPVPEDLDWFWLPWREDPRDAWILAPGKTMADLPAAPVVGISSDRREACCRARFPQAIMKPIRGTIPARLAQLDAGDFDAILMAGAALNRLGLADRVTEWVPLDILPVPEGQGYLAVTYRLGDPAIQRFRDFFIKTVRFVGAGVGAAEYCTLGGINDLRHAEVCLYDVLMDDALLAYLPKHAERVFVGKRCGEHSVKQPEITTLIARYARQGKRVVRLKGGDPGLFGRLAEEIDELDRLHLPYRVRAGVSALMVATTGTGMLLTKRGLSRGFTAMTPRAAEGGVAGVGREVRDALPLVLFMSVRVAAEMARQLIDEGRPETTPVAIVFNAGAEDEEIQRFTLVSLLTQTSALQSAIHADAPGLVVIGEVAASGYRREFGALRGARVLLTCSEALMEKAMLRVTDLGGFPIPRPLIRLVPCAAAVTAATRIHAYDWLVLTSPSAVHLLMRLVQEAQIDVRRLPKIMTCGPGSAAAFATYTIQPDLTPPMDYSAEGLAALLNGIDFTGQRVLRLRSEKAGPLLATVLREKGAVVEDVELYENQAVAYASLPPFDAVFFASASGVESFAAQQGMDALKDRCVVVIGKPTEAALRKAGRAPDRVAESATVDGAIETLAQLWSQKEMSA